MRKRERVETAMKLMETDRTPIYDLVLGDKFIRHFTGKIPPYGQAGVKAKCRAISQSLDMTRAADVGPVRPGVFKDEDGFVHVRDRWLHLGLKARPFNDEKGALEWLKAYNETTARRNKKLDLKKFSDRWRKDFIRIQNYLGDDTVVLIRQSEIGLDFIRFRLGLEYFTYIYEDEPDLIREFLDLYCENEIKIIHAIADYKLSPCALTYGDIAMKNTLMHSPQWLRKEFFPRLKKINQAYHQHGIKCLFHSDGYLMPVMEDLLDSGIDGLNPIETAAGMDLKEVYDKYGDRMFLTGGIDMSQLLPLGSPEETRLVCQEAIKAAPRGYFLGSTSELDDSAKMENVLAMLESVIK